MSADAAQRVLTDLATAFANADLLHGNVTFSAGIAESTLSEHQGELLKRADQLMYQAKDGGRNRICM